MSNLPSNLRAYVHWRDPSVYAGEEIECIITFKNIAGPSLRRARDNNNNNNNSRQESHGAGGISGAALSTAAQSTTHGGLTISERRESSAATASRRSSIVQRQTSVTRTPSASASRGLVQQGRGHRPALSLNVIGANAGKGGALQSAPAHFGKPPNGAAVRGHGRSLSIISLGSEPMSEGRVVPTSIPSSSTPGGKRPGPKHGRSASLQVLPKPSPLQASPHIGTPSTRQSSPLVESTTPPALEDEPLPVRPARRRPGIYSADTTPQLTTPSTFRRVGPPNPPPQVTASNTSAPVPLVERPKNQRNHSSSTFAQKRSNSPRPSDGISGPINNLNITRVLSETSTSGTPRSSSEFYSMSNRSDETLTSEVPSQYQQNGRLGVKPSHSHKGSRSRDISPQAPAQPETLMMGFAQTMGYFTLDGGLVNGAPFEEVKRKGVQGGGGVVGVERSKRSSGMFGAFSWGNIGESLGGFLGNDDLSSMAQMKATAGSKCIPLLSTPQNLLFVDLRLAPGESRSYNYRFMLPRGLPPSHKGRAIKVFYHLTLGVQRPEGQTVKHIDVPFRVLGSYNSRGEALGHDLMSPYILLQDAAKSKSVVHTTSAPLGRSLFSPRETQTASPGAKQGLEDFLRYTERLLEQRKESSSPLVSPTSPSFRKDSYNDQQPSTTKEAIDLAIMRANYVSENSERRKVDAQSANRFNIARAGQPVAVLTLLRAVYRLGEIVTGTLDFTAAAATSGGPEPSPTFSVVVKLESAEQVDTSLALRSSNSINRVTRRVHAVVRENTLYARQVAFNLGIPSSATPTFDTTGVSLVWQLRVEFTTQRLAPEATELLEEIGADERGTTYIARERLLADTFEIEVPLKVYGAPGTEGLLSGGDNDALRI